MNGCEYMNKITLIEQKKIELEILIYIDELCRQNHINYSLIGGTLIGALRHKGFIPWDDDIDIFLLRGDYERLIDLIRDSERYKVYIPGETENYFYGFTKIMDTRTVSYNSFEKELGFPEMGVFIDIFPFDNIPEGYDDKMIKAVNSYQKKAIIANRTASYYYSDNKVKSFVKKVMLYIPHVLYAKKNTAYWMDMAVKTAKAYADKNTEYIGSFFGNLTKRTGKKEIFPREVFEGYIEAEFEDHNFKIMKNYDAYLTAMFGDYMTPPPEEKRVLPHDYEFYWKEDK